MINSGTRTLTAAVLRQHAKEHHGTTRDAFLLAADNVSVGLSIPTDVRAIIDRALSFTQDRYGK
uniref:Uncharacterized protein n=1 Tax=feces metagenome TaxID=1861841 RepID=A0A7M2QN45_9ZZZZ